MTEYSRSTGAPVAMTVEDLPGDIRKIGFRGRFDVFGCEAIEEAFLETAADQKRRIVVDMSQINFLATIGIRLLTIVARAQEHHGGHFVLCSPQETVRWSLATAGIDTLIPVFSNMESALGEFFSSKRQPYHFQLTLKADIGEMSKIAGWLKTIWKLHRIDEQVAYDLEVATTEHTTNIIQYAYGSLDGDNRIMITVQIYPDRIETIIADKGVPFNPLEFDSDQPSTLAEATEGGFGIILTRGLSDEVSYRRTETDENELTLVYHRK